MKYCIGTHVIVSEGSGYESNKTGIIIDPKEVPLRKDGSGIPDLTGYYDKVDWKQQAALRMDEGYITTMFWNRLREAINDDQTPRYAPQVVRVVGREAKVLSYHSFPIGQHPEGCPIVNNMVALECRTAIGSRWYGCDAAWINSELRMVIRGTNSRDTVRMRWEECKET